MNAVIGSIREKTVAEQLNSLDPDFKANVDAWVTKHAPTDRIHHCVGVYNSDGRGDFASRMHNGVATEHLRDHIEYNLVMRFGRALFIDGICVNEGYLGTERCDKIAEELKAAPKVYQRSTAPYQ